ncbi:helix-turn-helix domain-containing protein [Streptomyces sp. ISL-10]|uniref:telomere-associated protein Tap n=1 Tax=Streptomyces sp. ISL-10 TaxID=2819172 RepID=UPI001BEAACAB|nr:helix-turn-helix domain-containing protein [Streptomyces sp. ISL-10]MBT2365472.1 helix-turn-helix domain-containing protein [Streptomyces sp. ISL-10]
MANEQAELFAAVDALLEQAAAQDTLPPPPERKRLREAAGVSQEQVARALKVRRETVTSWEAGRTEPRPPKRAAYARLLEGLAAHHPPRTAPQPDAAQDPLPESGAIPAPAPAASVPEQAATSQAPPAPERAAAAAPAAPAAPPGPEAGSVEGTVAAADVTPDPAPASAPGRAPARAPEGVPGAVPQRGGRTAADVPATTPDSGGRGSAGRPGLAAAPDRARKRSVEPPVPAVDPRFADGPLAVLDGDGRAHCVGGLILDCPADDVSALVEWALGETRLGAPRLNRNGKDADPLIVLTEAAAVRLGLPAALADRRSLRLPDDHPVVRRLARAKWRLTKRGFGPWPRIYRPAQAGQRRCVQLAVLPWGALDTRTWGEAATLPPPELARVLGTYAARVLTPRGSAAVSGLELMAALRPPTRAVQDPGTGAWTSGAVPGSLTEPVDPAPPEAPDEHPVVASLYPRGHRRTPDEVLDEEAFEWTRDAELLTDAECAKAYAVGIDVNTAFLAAANRLAVGLGEAVHVRAPAFDKSVPGCWLVDLSGIEIDPRLPNPFTPGGIRPDGPAWYATPTVAYARELVDTYRLPVTIAPVEAWVRTASAPYLDPWYKRLSEAYKATMADLGVKSGMSEPAFLAAMETHRQSDPALAAVLTAIKATVKGGIGKLRERPQGTSYRPGEPWPALSRPTWRPDIRAAVIATARVNMHRKLLRTALATQREPAPVGHLRLGEDALCAIALLSDGAVYLSDGPSPLDFLPHTADGGPAPGAFRLGVSPGMVKHEGTQSMMWAVQLLDQGLNPARHIKGSSASDDGE